MVTRDSCMRRIQDDHSESLMKGHMSTLIVLVEPVNHHQINENFIAHKPGFEFEELRNLDVAS